MAVSNVQLVEQLSVLNGAFGVQSATGLLLIRRFERGLRAYFSTLTNRISRQKLEEAISPDEVATRTAAVLADLSEPLLFTLIVWLARGYESALNIADDRIDRLFKEAIPGEGELVNRPRAPVAVEYATRRGAELVTRMNDTTRKIVQETVAEGISEGLGVQGTARLLRNRLMDMRLTRSHLIALTEMNDAMSDATFRRFKDRGMAFKTTILSDRPCPICIRNHQEGPVPVDQAFPSGHMRTPFHPGCLCALVATRGPKGRITS